MRLLSPWTPGKMVKVPSESHTLQAGRAAWDQQGMRILNSLDLGPLYRSLSHGVRPFVRIQSLESHNIFEYTLSYNTLEGFRLKPKFLEDSVWNSCQGDKSEDSRHLKMCNALCSDCDLCGHSQ